MSDFKSAQTTVGRLEAVRDRVTTATMGMAKRAVDMAVVTAIGAYPTDPYVVDLTNAVCSRFLVPGVVEAGVHVIESKYVEARDVIQGKCLTEQPFGPNGAPSDRMYVALKPFTEPGVITVLLPSSTVSVFLVDNAIIYPAQRFSHYGVRVHTSQLDKVVMCVEGLASIAFMYRFTADVAVKPLATKALAFPAEFTSNGVVQHTSTSAVSHKALDLLTDPFLWRYVPERGRTVGIVVRDGKVVINNVLYDALRQHVVVVGGGGSMTNIFADFRTTVEYFTVGGDDDWVPVDHGVERKPVVLAKL